MFLCSPYIASTQTKTSIRTTMRCFPESQVTLCFPHSHILLEILFCHKNEPILGFLDPSESNVSRGNKEKDTIEYRKLFKIKT